MATPETERIDPLIITHKPDGWVFQIDEILEKEGAIIYKCPGCGIKLMIMPIIPESEPTENNESVDTLTIGPHPVTPKRRKKASPEVADTPQQQ